MSAMQRAMEAREAYQERIGEAASEPCEGGVKIQSMSLLEYEHQRMELEKEMEEANERERMHKEKAHLDFQKECKTIASKIGALKHQQSELLRKYKQDKIYFHARYRQEKQAINARMHTLKMQYLTLNGIEPAKKKTEKTETA